jgi:hypothetical protein
MIPQSAEEKANYTINKEREEALAALKKKWPGTNNAGAIGLEDQKSARSESGTMDWELAGWAETQHLAEPCSRRGDTYPTTRATFRRSLSLCIIRQIYLEVNKTE